MMACKLRMFENRVLRRICGPMRDEGAGGWRKLHNDPNDEYPSANVIQVIKYRRMKWAGHAACMGARRAVYRALVGKREGKNVRVTGTWLSKTHKNRTVPGNRDECDTIRSTSLLRSNVHVCPCSYRRQRNLESAMLLSIILFDNHVVLMKEL